uniref:HDC09160 n=1 Tax=Drosophila melanogaster TaxID=7227 RepID=Q6ILK9_DROME|nr:TPA_inf: HDC09160 [Drosophila melanogaster]
MAFTAATGPPPVFQISNCLPHKSGTDDNILVWGAAARRTSFCDLLIRIYCRRLSRFTYPCGSADFQLPDSQLSASNFQLPTG